jgi:hypothetical protein
MSPVAIDLLIRALVLLAAAWLAVTVLRRQSASLRALVWTAALAGILVLPVMSSVAPRLDVPVWRAESPVTVAPATMVASTNAIQVPRVASVPQEMLSSEAGSLDPAFGAADEPISWSQVAFLVWACVTLVLAARIVFSHISQHPLAASDRYLCWRTPARPPVVAEYEPERPRR